MFDLLIRNGLVYDGTGAPAHHTDLAIQDGRIAAVGAIDGGAHREIDADGLCVTPGFVDVHTHYDGQATWDNDLLPSAAHGVTTAVLGNCGVGFAPCRATDRERLVRLFEGVEDIPGAALDEGITWQWQTFPEYLDHLGARARTMDVAALLTHDALRVHVMGERAIAGSAPTDDDLRAMAQLVDEAMHAGAVGVSTGRTDNHRAIDGSPTPASEAAEGELRTLAAAMARHGRGVLQAVSDFDIEHGPARFDGEFDVLEQFAAAAPGRPLWISWLQRDFEPNQWRRMANRAEAAQRKGVDIRLLAAPRGIGVLLGLEATFHPFIGHPSYRALANKPLADRVAALRDPAVRARLLAERPERVAGDGSPVPPLVDRLLATIDQVSFRIFPLGQVPNYEPPVQSSVGAHARARGVSALEALLDAMLADDGHALLYFPVFNYGAMNLSTVAEMLNHPLALPSLGDGGAHCGTICDASMPTFFLMHWARDKRHLRMEDAVSKLSREPALGFGFTDRGVLKPGFRADINLIDLQALTLDAPVVRRDLPAGGRRFLQAARGFRATLVRGEVVSEDGVLTGQRPGTVVRMGRA